VSNKILIFRQLIEIYRYIDIYIYISPGILLASFHFFNQISFIESWLVLVNL